MSSEVPESPVANLSTEERRRIIDAFLARVDADIARDNVEAMGADAYAALLTTEPRRAVMWYPYEH